MKPRASRLSFALAIFAILACNAGLSADIHNKSQPMTATETSEADAMPTVLVRALGPSDDIQSTVLVQALGSSDDIQSTVVVNAVKHNGIQPALVWSVMVLFAVMLMWMRDPSRQR